MNIDEEVLQSTIEGYAGVVSIAEDNPTLKVEDGYFELSYSQTDDSVQNQEFYARFIKKCENMVRTHEDYKTYINYLKSEVGLNFCQIMSNIDDDMAPIEMHHGPVLNLFDICGIVLKDQLTRFGHANTFTVADQVLEDHFDNIIQIVMLSETMHDVLHAKGKYLSMRHAFGDMGKFLKKYEHLMEDYQRNIIYSYIKASMETDTQFLEEAKLGDSLTTWSKMNYLYE